MAVAEQNVTLRRAVKYLVDHDEDGRGNLSRLGEVLGVSRQRVHQIARQYRTERLAAMRPTLSSRVVGGIREKVSA